jgi:large subunit ribosomal protein L24
MATRKYKPGLKLKKRTTSKQPRKQRKYMFNAPKHHKRKELASHLSEELLLKYNVRSVTVIKGDTVKIMRGALKGHVGKVAKVNTRRRLITVEGATMAKADGTQLAKWFHPSNVLITKLELGDPYRRRKLGELAEDYGADRKEEVEKESDTQKDDKSSSSKKDAGSNK